MKIFNVFPASRLLRCTAVLTAAILGTGMAGAQTYQHGNSTTIIEQDGDGSGSDVQVEQYDDGQRIITQDGNSTDITIQREGAGHEDQQSFRQRIEDRFPPISPNEDDDSND